MPIRNEFFFFKSCFPWFLNLINSSRSNCWAAATKVYMELTHSLGKFLVPPAQIYGYQKVVIFEVFKICPSMYWQFLVFWHFSHLGLLKSFWNHQQSTLREILVRNKSMEPHKPLWDKLKLNDCKYRKYCTMLCWQGALHISIYWEIS